MLSLKKSIVTFIIILSALSHANAQIKIAVMDFKAGVGVTQGDVDGISAIFGTYFINPEKFILVERLQLDKTISEQGFQQSTLTQQQMVRLGKILNLSKIVIGNVNVVSGQYNVDVRMVNVETGAIEGTDGETWERGTSYRELMKNLANRLMTKIVSPTNIGTTNKISDIIPTSVVTLLGYLQVYPCDLGEFPSIPTNIIANLNQQNIHGYNDWRIPTTEELALMKANSSKLGLTTGNYMSSDGTRSGIVRLVTTGKTVTEKESLRIQQEIEKRRIAEAERNKYEIVINGIRWATRNVGTPRTFVTNPEDYGNYYTWLQAQNCCPSGWRLPTEEECISLIKAGGSKYSGGWKVNGLFLPPAGYRTTRMSSSSGSVSAGISFGYWSSASATSRLSNPGGKALISTIIGLEMYDCEMDYMRTVRCVREL